MLLKNTVRSYLIHSTSWRFRDTPERIDYHIESGDYLPLLATMMGFMEEALRSNDTKAINEQKTQIALKLAQELRQDLRYVGANYRLTPVDPKDRYTLRSGNVLRG